MMIQGIGCVLAFLLCTLPAIMIFQEKNRSRWWNLLAVFCPLIGLIVALNLKEYKSALDREYERAAGINA